MQQETIAALRGYGRFTTVRAGGRVIRFRKIGTAYPSDPGIAEITARIWANCAGHFLTPRSNREQQRARKRWKSEVRLNELADETGTPILYTSGVNRCGRAFACISFPAGDGCGSWSAEPAEQMRS